MTGWRSRRASIDMVLVRVPSLSSEPSDDRACCVHMKRVPSMSIRPMEAPEAKELRTHDSGEPLLDAQ